MSTPIDTAASALWSQHQDPDGAPGVKIYDDPRKVAREVFATVETSDLAQVIGAHRSTLIASKNLSDGRILNSRTCDCGYLLTWSGWAEAHDVHLATEVRTHLLQDPA